MRLAIIDCGTNTFNLLIAELFENKEGFSVVHNEKKSVKLGEGGLNNGKIAPKPFQRGLDVFESLVKTARQMEVQSVKAFATSAIRSSTNGPDFVKSVHHKTGVMIQVINGDTEAQYIYKGVNLALNQFASSALIMDIGGGSTEFIIAQNNKVVWKRSFDLGAARLLELLKPANPLTNEQKTNLIQIFDELLSPLTEKMKEVEIDTLIGCSGSFESVSDMILHFKDSKITSGAPVVLLDNNDFEVVYNELINSTEAERRNMPGLVHFRVDTIVFAVLFINYIKNLFGINQMYYSSYSLKEGVLADIMLQNIAV
ncbi:MAG: exopolyphosphatase [bacterium]